MNITEEVAIRRRILTRLRRQRDRLRFLAYYYAPWIFPHPWHTPEEKEYYFNRDGHKNAISRPVRGQEARPLCIWAVEFYSPSTVHRLKEYFSAFGWEQGASTRGSAMSWVQRSRERSHSGGWWNLGYLSRQKPRFSMSGFHTVSKSLPIRFSQASATVHSVLPSLTCVAVCFRLSDAARTAFQSALKTHTETTFKANKDGSISIIDPEQCKVDLILESRLQIRREIASWFRRELPGTFTSLDQCPPMMELSEINLCGSESLDRNFLDLCFPRSPYDEWIQKTEPHLVLDMNEDFSEERKIAYSILRIDRRDRGKLDLSAWGGNTEDAVARFFDHKLGYFAVRWGYNKLLIDLERRLASLRDEHFSPISHEARRSGRRKLRAYWQQSMDIHMIANEGVDSPSYLNHHAGDFRSARPSNGDDPNLVDLLDETAKRSARRLLQQIELITKVRADLNNAFSILEAHRSNALMKRLTWINLLIALMALLTAFGSAAIAWMTVPETARRGFAAVLPF